MVLLVGSGTTTGRHIEVLKNTMPQTGPPGWEYGRKQLYLFSLATGIGDSPLARTEAQLNILTFITTINLVPEEEDYYEWELNGRKSDKYSTGEVYHAL